MMKTIYIHMNINWYYSLYEWYELRHVSKIQNIYLYYNFIWRIFNLLVIIDNQNSATWFFLILRQFDLESSPIN